MCRNKMKERKGRTTVYKDRNNINNNDNNNNKRAK